MSRTGRPHTLNVAQRTDPNGKKPISREGRPQSAVAAPVWADRSRRLLNLAAAASLLALGTPLMLLIASLVKATSRGPVLFVQERIGLDRRRSAWPSGNCRRRTDVGGKPFKMLKFRTMYVHAGGYGQGQIWAHPQDPRITPVGRMLRKYRLDELPQLINVLRGDMNLVGPRPEQPKIFQDLRSQIDGYHRRQQVLPGITGWAQINRPYDRSLEDVRNKLFYDLEYIERPSALEDLKIIARTVPVMFLGRGGW